jgi:hypothetical protein
MLKDTILVWESPVFFHRHRLLTTLIIPKEPVWEQPIDYLQMV